MALTLSTGCVKNALDTTPLRTLLNLCKINIYSGTKPTSPDDVPNGTLLVTISNAGTATGLTWDTTAPGGVLPKAPAETWSGTIAATGTAGWFRIWESGDTPSNASTTAVRIDGTISSTGADLNLTNLSLVSGAPFIMNTATITLPKS